jgi:ribosomal protein S18 acetylase RimI-like enzyme
MRTDHPIETPRGAAACAIRRARAQDHEAVVREMAAYLRALGASLDVEGLDHDVAAWRREYDGTSGVLLVVECVGGTVVGTAGVRLLGPGVGEIKRMWLRHYYRGVGLGRRLMDACLAEARALGCGVVRLDSQRRLAAALGLYRAFGFREVADYNGNPRANVWMEMRL